LVLTNLSTFHQKITEMVTKVVFNTFEKTPWHFRRKWKALSFFITVPKTDYHDYFGMKKLRFPRKTRFL